MQNSTDSEVTAWVLTATMKEGQKRDNKQRKRKIKKNTKLIICTKIFFFYT